jgi:hypothetical protein
MASYIGYSYYSASIGGTACPELGTGATQEPNFQLSGSFNVMLDTGAPATISGANNPNHQRVTSPVTIAAITDGTSNSAMFSEIIRSTSVNNTVDEVPQASLLNVYGQASGFSTSL